MSEHSRASCLAARTLVRIKRIAATTEKPSNASAVVRTAISWRLKSKKVEISCRRGNSPARAGTTKTGLAPTAIRPLRASDVHDSRVRRIATITPDMVCPKPHDLTPGASPHDPPEHALRFDPRV